MSEEANLSSTTNEQHIQIPIQIIRRIRAYRRRRLAELPKQIKDTTPKSLTIEKD